MMKLAQLVRSPRRSPKNQLSSWRRVDSQKSMEVLVLYRQCVTLLRARRTAAREERLSCPALAKLRMGTLSASRLKVIKIPKQQFWRNQGFLSNHRSNKWHQVPFRASKIQFSITIMSMRDLPPRSKGSMVILKQYKNKWLQNPLQRSCRKFCPSLQ